MPRKTGTDAAPAAPPYRPRFNEAAARCRGKPGRRRTTAHGAARFNEAAARCRGKLAFDPGLDAALVGASMRPRPDAAENRKGRGVFHTLASLQ